MKKDRILSFFLVLAMLAMYIPAVFAEKNRVMISTPEDLVKFSKQCTLDSWSLGKTVELTNDIDMNGKEYIPIPTFGGIFNGNGYTISNIKLTMNGSHFGFFRYVRKGGTVNNLTIKANIATSGSKCYLGGFAGENDGIIRNCNFFGTVKGKDVIGGIVGENKLNGIITGCTISGVVLGENKVGGIVGKNNGLILNCTNNAEINISYEEKKEDISNIDFDMGAIVENYKNGKENNEESVLGNSDIGGIAGYNSGIIEGSVNNSKVGYLHIGYNVGGICGRQSGYILGCSNYGFIEGRKDVGGIVGQAEPYIILDMTHQSIRDIRNELNNLDTLTNTFLADTDAINDELDGILNNISLESKSAQKSAKKMLDLGDDFIDTNLGKVNAEVAVLSNALRKTQPVFENLDAASEELINVIDGVDSVMTEIDDIIVELYSEENDIPSVKKDMSRAAKYMQRAFKKASKASELLQSAVTVNNEKNVRAALGELGTAIKELIEAKKEFRKSLELIKTAIETNPDKFDKAGFDAEKLKNAINNSIEKINIMIEQSEKIKNSIDTILENVEIDYRAIVNGMSNIRVALGFFDEALYYLATDKNISGISKSLSNSLGYLWESGRELTEIADELSQNETLNFSVLGDDFKNAGDGLFESLSDISLEIDKLKNTASKGGKNITKDLRTISNKFNKIMNMLIERVEEIANYNKDFSEIFADDSNIDIEETREGKIDDCINSGKIEADRNVGGIAGTMAIEYAKDPEDDIDKPDTLNFTYRTKDILINCVNDGAITGKKDCIGGVVGFCEIGTVYKCEGYGNAESTNGNYVGGVAGKSDSLIRKSYGKCTVKGKRYVGGVAGKGKNVIGSSAIVNVIADESLGAVLGNTDDIKSAIQNTFVDNGLGAIDGISYQDVAEPISYDELKEKPDIPKRFISFTITFIADDKIVEKKEIEYDSSTDFIKYPQIPQKKGCFGKWEDIEAETIKSDIEVRCQYKPYITVIASEEKDESGKIAIALAEGQFDDRAELHITNSTEKPPLAALGRRNVYKISLKNTNEQGNITVRILNKKKDRVKAWELSKDGWKEVKTKSRGKYVILSVSKADSTICMQYKKQNFVWIWIMLILLLGICVGMGLWFYKNKSLSFTKMNKKRILNKNTEI